MTPLQRYQSDLKEKKIISDPVQMEIVGHTESLYRELTENNTKGWFSLGFFSKQKQPVKGLYLWGGVGRGKTYIVDSFYDCLPFDNKIRLHFHRFMQMVHGELKSMENVADPLKPIAAKLAGDAIVICFDEFHVSDITDAMLLSGLFHALFERGVTLVATSNQHPEKLYREGLQRERFLPAIALIKTHTEILNLDTETDYRLRYLDRAEIYHYPLDSAGRNKLKESFETISPEVGRINSTIEIQGRKIRVIRFAAGVVWFDFHEICDAPRGVADYIEIARQFQTALIENIPAMDDMTDDAAKRFIVMVDEFYDRNVKLIMTAEVKIQDLYRGKRHAEVFARTSSRLIEMQSREYLARPHLP